MTRFRPYALALSLSCGLFVGTAHAAPQPMSYPICQKSLNYKILFNGAHIGNYQKQENWQGRQANINSHGQISLLVTSASMTQRSAIKWSAQDNQFISTSFERNIDGLMSGKTAATTTNNGHQMTAVIDGETQRFISEGLPILDTDAIGEQIRYDIMNSKKAFSFNMLSDGKVKNYSFKVVGNATLDTNYGRLNTIKVVQTKEKDRELILWFAPTLDYQMVQGQYKRSVINVEAILQNLRNTCPTQTAI